MMFRIFMLVLVAFIVGCNSIGPVQLREERQDFNVALQQTNDEQMLLNLIRMKYRDTTMFLEVSALASQYSLTGNVTAAGKFADNFGNSVGLGSKLEYQQKPTITYAPLHGEKFVTRLLKQLGPKTISLLYKSGWSVERLMLVCFERVKNMPNAPSASGPTPSYVPRFKKFHDLADFLRKQQVRGALDFTLAQQGEGGPLGFKLSLNELAEKSAAASLSDFLGEKADNHYFFSPLSNKGLTFETRSLREILFFLSQGIEVPESHVENGKVTVTKDESGKVFDWQQVTGKLMNIKTSSSLIAPQDAYVVVRYRGHWFYIADDDLNSKSTFGLLMQLYNLQAGDVKDSPMVLTLPIGG